MPRKMKESGVEWLGQIPEGWGCVRLKNVIKGREGGAWGDDVDGGAGIPCVCLRIADFDFERGVFKDLDIDKYTTRRYTENQIDKLQLRPGDLLIEKSGGGEKTPVGRCVLFDKSFKALYANFMDRLRVRETAKPKFVAYFLRSLYFKDVTFEYVKQTTGIQNLDLAGLLAQQCISLPSLPEQQRISAFLDERCAKIDGMIAEAKASIEDYKKWKQSLVSDAVTGRNVNELGGNGLVVPSGVDWCPEIPKAWKRVNPKALFSLRTQRAISGERQLTASQHHGIIYQDDFMRLENQKVVTVEKDFSILKHVEPGDFVISMRSFQGGLEYSESRGCISSAYVMLIPNLKKVYPPFYRWFFKSCKYINALQSTSNLIRDGQAMRYSNFAQVSLFDIPISDQKRIATFLDEKCAAIDKLVGEKESLIADLEAYKKSLIFETVTGKREVA